MPRPRTLPTHPSAVRLLEAAAAATAALPPSRQIRSLSAVGKRMGVAAAVVTNWRTRGVSHQGAVAAERLFGCSAQWILHGGVPAQPAPPVPFSPELTARLRQLQPDLLRRVENVVRAQLDMAPLQNHTPRRAQETAAA